MSFYRRFISYMYDSHNEKNEKNCGFLKIEVKNQKLSILFQLKNAPCQDKCDVYLCSRNTVPAYIYLESIPIIKGTICHKIETNSLKIGEHDLSFGECCGLLCTDEKGNICSTCWDANGKLPKFEWNKKEETEQIEQKKGTADNINTEPEIETVDTINTKPQKEAVDIVNTEPEKETVEPPTEKKPDLQTRSFSEVWEHLQKEFPALDPFEDDIIVEGIKISPSDLGYLQACSIDLGHNQFLLHGYKSYHHLLLGRLRGQMHYFIGVPGIYDPQEQFMSKMFGFPCFKPIRECRQKNGQFGYWIRCFH